MTIRNFNWQQLTQADIHLEPLLNFLRTASEPAPLAVLTREFIKNYRFSEK